MRRRSWLTLLGALLTACAAGCAGAKDELVVVFPDEEARAATSVLAVTAFEPLLFSADSSVPELVKCSAVGSFPPTRVLDPDTISSFPNLGRLLSDHRKGQAYPLDGDWTLDIPNIKEDSPTNPWGAVLVYIEARGEVRAAPKQGGGPVTATLLSGCYCVRTRTGSHPNRALDQAVKQACAPLADNEGKERRVPLASVMSPVFKLEAGGVQDLVAPRNQQLAPGPEVRVTTRRCSDSGSSNDGCFRCTQPCAELDDLSNVPVRYAVDQPGGATAPKSQIVLTDADGRATAQIRLDGCTSDVRVRASVVGRPDTEVDFRVKCVDPISGFRCDELVLSGGREPRALARLPGAAGEPDFVAILYDTGTNAALEVVNPLRPADTVTIDYPGASAHAVHGFYYDVQDPTAPARPTLVVVTSPSGRGGTPRVYVYAWEGGALIPDEALAGSMAGRPMERDCPTWVCVGEMPTCGTPAEPCGCHMQVEFQTPVLVSTADIDGDGRSDLVVASANDLPITTYYSSRATGGRRYQDDGCECGKYAQMPTSFQVLDFGGSGELAGATTPDLVLGAPGGAFVQYGARSASQQPVIPCGLPLRFGDLVPVRDLARGYFRCDRQVDPSGCDGFQDLVEVAAKQLGGGSFDDPGTIRVVYGASRDLSTALDLFDEAGASIALVPRTLAGEEAPRDPQSAEVGDINGDGFDDVAVLFRSSAELHVWLGGAAQGLGEVESGVNLKRCEGSSGPPGEQCTALEQFALPDFDGDGRAELVVLCNPLARAALRRYDPQVAP